MVVVIIGMLVCIGLALVVVALVALPARRDGAVMFVSRPPGRDLEQELGDLAPSQDPESEAGAAGTAASTRARPARASDDASDDTPTGQPAHAAR